MSSALADAIEASRDLLLRYLEGFHDGNAADQAPGLPNHAAWTLGHLALTMHRAADRIAEHEAPLGWDPEPYAFGSRPSAGRADYPSLAELTGRFGLAARRLADTVRALGDSALGREVRWGRAGTVTVGALLVRMVFHNGTHCGQLIDLRRALGMPRLLG